MLTLSRRLATVIATLCLLAPAAWSQSAVGTAFTYQGQLQSAGAPANGTYDIRFRLYDAATGGSQVGSTVCVDNAPVSNGVFMVTLDFGAQFTGAARWLELAARADTTVGNCSSGAFSPLLPRQPLTPTPYAAGLALPQSLSVNSAAAALDISNAGGDGIAGTSSSIGRSGVYGVSSLINGYGVYGRNTSSGNIGVLALGGSGVYGSTANASNAGGYFENLSATTSGDNAAGAWGVSTAGIGLYGVAGAASGGTATINPAGVVGDSSTLDGVTGIAGAGGRSGVSGYALDANGGGVYGANYATSNYGVIGGVNYGVYGASPTTTGMGVQGIGTGVDGNGVVGQADNGTTAWGVSGESLNGVGVRGESTTGIGVRAVSDSGNGLKASSNSYDGIDSATSGYGKSGVYGHTDNVGGFGVAGWNFAENTNGALGTQTAGVSGYAYGTTGLNYGVFGSTSSPSGYGGCFIGRGYFSDNVGIGIEPSTVPLQVVGGTDASLGGGGNIVVGQFGAANVVIDNNEIMARNSGSAANLYLNAQGGQVGIGTNAPTAELSVNGAANKPGGGTWSTFSDARLKKNVRPLTGALDTLMALRGVTFEYIDPAAINELPGTRTGMIAQEVEQVVPDWVDQGPDGMKRVTYRGFEALTVEALRDLRDRGSAATTADRSRLAALEQDNRDLRRELEDLRSAVRALATQRVSAGQPLSSAR